MAYVRKFQARGRTSIITDTEPKPGENCGGLITGEVLEVNKPHEIKFTWKGEELAEHTIVTFVLEETEKGTSFRIKHEGFVNENTKVVQGYSAGWAHHQSQIDNIEFHENQS